MSSPLPELILAVVLMSLLFFVFRHKAKAIRTDKEEEQKGSEESREKGYTYKNILQKRNLYGLSILVTLVVIALVWWSWSATSFFNYPSKLVPWIAGIGLIIIVGWSIWAKRYALAIATAIAGSLLWVWYPVLLEEVPNIPRNLPSFEDTREQILDLSVQMLIFLGMVLITITGVAYFLSSKILGMDLAKQNVTWGPITWAVVLDIWGMALIIVTYIFGYTEVPH